MRGGNKDILVIDESSLAGHDEGWSEVPEWSEGFLDKVRAECRSLSEADIRDLSIIPSSEELSLQGLELNERLRAMLLARQDSH